MGVVFLHSYTVCGVDLTKFFVGVDFCDVIEAAFSDGDFILFGEVVKSDLIPIAFFTAGKVINLLDMFSETCTVLIVPIRYTEHMIAVYAAYRHFGYITVLACETPIVGFFNGNAEIICLVLIFSYKVGIIKEKIGFSYICALKMFASAHYR